MVLAHVSGPTSLLHCPNEVVSNIFWHVNDSGTLTNIALTCKLLNALVKPKIFESCPVIENQDHLLSLDALDSRFARFSSALSDSNAPLIRHLLLPIKAHVTNEVGTMLQKCVNLDRVTLYTSSDGIGPHEAPDYLSDKVKSLTLRIVPFCYTEDIQRARARFPPVERDAFDMLKSFTRVTSLRVLVEPSLERNPIQVWNWIATTTKHLQITTLHTNVAPDATGDYAAQLNLLPDLQSMSLDFWQPKFDFPSSHCSSPRECPGRFISRRGLFRLMASEEHRQWKYNLAGTHVILNGFDEYEHERYEVKEFWDKIIERNNVDIFNNWVSQSGLQLLVHCDQREDPTTHSIINCGHPNVYLDIAGYELSDLDIEGFLTKVVPTTRALFVDTTVLWGSELCRSSVSEMFRHVAVEAPDFQLQHLQNFPPTEFAACHSNFCFEDARAFQPLSVLPTLTSIDLDMAYFTLDDRNVYDFPDKTEGFGDHVIQITWLTTCPNLKTLCTRNFTATTTADDNFLHQLPNNYKQLTWTLTGTIHLPQSHYSALVAPQHPFDDPVINPDTPFPPENYELVHPLPDVLLRKSIELASVVGSRWKDKIIKDARTEKLILNFKIKIMFSQEWSFPESAFGEGKVRKWLERGLPQYVIDMVNKLNEEYPE